MSGSSQLYRIKCQIFSVFKNLCTSPSLRGASCPDQCSVIGSQCSEFSDGPSPRRSVLRVHGPSLDLSPVTCSCRELPGSEQNSSPWRSSMSTKDKSYCLILKNTDVAKLPSATTRAPRTNFQEVPYRKKQSQNLLRSFSGESTAVLRLHVCTHRWVLLRRNQGRWRVLLQQLCTSGFGRVWILTSCLSPHQFG